MLKQLVVQFDAVVLGNVQHWPGWLYVPMTIATFIGNPITLGVIAAAVSYVGWQHSHTRIIVVMAAAFAAMGVNSILKHFIHRPRPDTLYVSNMWFQTSSFPSGHAFGSTVVLGLLAFLATQFLSGIWQIAVPIVLGLLIIAIGVSRVYLGAHYPTDVVAGWALGLVVLGVIIFFMYNNL